MRYDNDLYEIPTELCVGTYNFFELFEISTNHFNYYHQKIRRRKYILCVRECYFNVLKKRKY